MTTNYKKTIRKNLKLRKSIAEVYFKFLYIALFDHQKGIKFYATYCRDDVIEHLNFVFKVDLKQKWFDRMNIWQELY